MLSLLTVRGPDWFADSFAFETGNNRADTALSAMEVSGRLDTSAEGSPFVGASVG